MVGTSCQLVPKKKPTSWQLVGFGAFGVLRLLLVIANAILRYPFIPGSSPACVMDKVLCSLDLENPGRPPLLSPLYLDRVTRDRIQRHRELLRDRWCGKANLRGHDSLGPRWSNIRAS